MGNLFRAFLFRLKRDLTFRITLIIGGALAIVITLIYFAIDLSISEIADGADNLDHMFCNGQSMLINSVSPAQNFGLAIPINLITFTVLEFTQGTIRNKIITGNSKGKIYFGLLFSGLVFTILLIVTYVGLCVGIGSIIGGFDAHGTILAGLSASQITPEFIWKFIVLVVLVYVLIACVTIFFATLFRSIGPSIPVVIILIIMCYFSATVVGSLGMIEDLSDIFKNLAKIMMYVNPLYSLSAYDTVSTAEGSLLTITNQAFISQIINNAVYIAAFTIGGWLIFRKRDVK